MDDRRMKEAEVCPANQSGGESFLAPFGTDSDSLSLQRSMGMVVGWLLSCHNSAAADSFTVIRVVATVPVAAGPGKT